jgi:phosphatidylserine decarboxylase
LKNEGVPIVKEGLPFLLVFLVASVAFAVGHLWSACIPAVLLTIYTAFFFRNPERLPPVGSTMVASPADGRIIYIGAAVEPEFVREEMQKISIFMSLWDVHVNRVPLDGTVRDMRYHRGRFMAAFEERASEENERSAMLLETSQGQRVVVVQVAGLIARRIVSYPTIGAFLLKGQRMGLIRFGSRCDIYLPRDAEIRVKHGEKVLGGETILAELKEKAAS